ncbi:hypothetical protein CDV53_13365 [Haematobacter missouriensis]|uniref:Uncharacterized protein n=1 Tax=Haematobacter missouriensis TaxID=366616 RepID=A0ABX3ZRC2_9RHOB|nr:hypothetical protein CDV53_13365 [Haematobacter missouriensis]
MSIAAHHFMFGMQGGPGFLRKTPRRSSEDEPATNGTLRWAAAITLLIAAAAVVIAIVIRSQTAPVTAPKQVIAPEVQVEAP